MFTRPRPTPSARTIKLLYHLGYICSGTAAGLMTLCLEEQRRRIQTLQKVADAGKVLRQHPRYQGHLALAVEPAHDFNLTLTEGEWHSAPLAHRSDRRRWHESRSEYNVSQRVATSHVAPRREPTMRMRAGLERMEVSKQRISGPRDRAARDEAASAYYDQSRVRRLRDGNEPGATSDQPTSDAFPDHEVAQEPKSIVDESSDTTNNSGVNAAKIYNSAPLLELQVPRNPFTKTSLRGREVKEDSSPGTVSAGSLTTGMKRSPSVAKNWVFNGGASPAPPKDDSLLKLADLKALWRRTRNIEVVRAKVREWSRTLSRSKNNKAWRKLDTDLLHVYVSAGEKDLAVNLAKRIQDTDGASTDDLFQIALLFAKEQSWTALSRLLNIVDESGVSKFDATVSRTFNAVVFEYACHHTPQEVWTFVNHAVRTLGFEPNKSTSFIVLQCFVSKRDPGLIPKWLDFVAELGHGVTIGARMAAGLLREYYITHRPSHASMMWLCHNLTLRSPSLASQNLAALVEQAIGYDIRHASNRDMQRQTHAQMRLERLETSRDLIPSPGFGWNGQLYLDELDRDSDQAEVDSLVETARTRIKNTEGKMWLQMSLRDYHKVLALYDEAIQHTNNPAPTDLLNIAVEASLRLHTGEPSHAGQIVRQAKAEGLDPTCVQGLIMMHRLKRLSLESTAEASRLRVMVLAFYRNNSLNRSYIGRYVVFGAARTLIKQEFSAEALLLLTSLYTDESPRHLELDTTAMTVFLSGYIAQRSVEGVQWVVETVLSQNIRIDRLFMSQLKAMIKSKYKLMGKQTPEVEQRLDSWVQRCVKRQQKQQWHTRWLGDKLVDCIAEATESKVKSAVDPQHVPAETGPVDEVGKEADFVDESYYSDEISDDGQIIDRYDEMKERMSRDMQAEKRVRERMQSSTREMSDARHDNERSFSSTDIP